MFCLLSKILETADLRPFLIIHGIPAASGYRNKKVQWFQPSYLYPEFLPDH